MALVSWIEALIKAHPVYAWWLLAVGIDNLPKPVGSPFYSWFFGVAQALGANLVRAKNFGFKVSSPSPNGSVGK
jgi:hypothetical protein